MKNQFTILLAGVLSISFGPAAFHAAAQTKSQTPPAVKEPVKAVAVLRSTKGNDVRGRIMLTEDDGSVRITGRIRGLTPGKHGFHIHEFGDVRAADGTSAGGHYSPHGNKHGGPQDKEHHAGDLGNIVANEDGVAVVDKTSADFKLHFVVGRAIVVHGGADDFESQPSGDAGARVAVGVIGIANPKIAPRPRGESNGRRR